MHFNILTNIFFNIWKNLNIHCQYFFKSVSRTLHWIIIKNFFNILFETISCCLMYLIFVVYLSHLCCDVNLNWNPFFINQFFVLYLWFNLKFNWIFNIIYHVINLLHININLMFCFVSNIGFYHIEIISGNATFKLFSFFNVL